MLKIQICIQYRQPCIQSNIYTIYIYVLFAEHHFLSGDQKETKLRLYKYCSGITILFFNILKIRGWSNEQPTGIIKLISKFHFVVHAFICNFLTREQHSSKASREVADR